MSDQGPYGSPPPDPDQTQSASDQQPFANQQRGPDVPDYLVWSILETLFCCLPFGIAGIVYSAQANSKKGNHDFQGAIADAAKAKKMLVIGIVVGIVSAVLYFAFLAFVAIVGGTNAEGGY